VNNHFPRSGMLNFKEERKENKEKKKEHQRARRRD
jgi:hypothetical protein